MRLWYASVSSSGFFSWGTPLCASRRPRCTTTVPRFPAVSVPSCVTALHLRVAWHPRVPVTAHPHPPCGVCISCSEPGASAGPTGHLCGCGQDSGHGALSRGPQVPGPLPPHASVSHRRNSSHSPPRLSAYDKLVAELFSWLWSPPSVSLRVLGNGLTSWSPRLFPVPKLHT